MQLMANIPYMLLCLLPLKKDMVVAFVFLELERPHDEAEVVVYLLELSSIELFRLDELFSNR